jgi:DNA/RNA endonuclease YhcR with UshA esterase domain
MIDMKSKILYLLGLLFCGFALTLTSCQGDFDEPVKTADEVGIGNSSIDTTNVVSIAQLKEKYKNYINTSYSYKKVEEPMEIKGYVTGNDVQGNLYNELVIDDGTGAITIGVAQGGLYGLFPVGAEVIIELNGLSVGNYGLHPQIGTPYTSAKGQNSIGRMSRAVWNQHFRLTGKSKTIDPIEFYSSWNPASDGLTYSGKLVTMKNVSFKGADGKKTFANASAGPGSVSTYFNELPTTTMVYTSNFADFASNPLPTDTVNVTGILKRYNNSWELIIRSLDDIKASIK